MGHISDDWLERYAMGTLHEAHVAKVEEHLLICHGCQDRLKATDEYIAAMRRAAEKLEREDEIKGPHDSDR
jgi:anti-sigma factor ChrR (cupin superfamily)